MSVAWVGGLRPKLATLRRTALRVGPSRSWVADAAPRLTATVGESGDWRTERVAFTDTGLAVAMVRCAATARRVVVKVPSTAEGADSLRRQAAALDALHAEPRLCGWPGRLPRCLGQGEADGHYYCVEEALPGTPVTAAALRRAGSGALVGAAADLIGNLHDRTAQQMRLDAATVDEWVARPLRHIGGFLAGRYGRGHALERLGSQLTDALLGRTVRTCWIHGDFWPGNLLVSGTALTGVVDWDRASAGQLPLHDLLHVHVLSRRLTAGDELGDVVLRALRRGLAEAIDMPAESVAGWLDGIPQRPAVLLYWLRHISLFIESEGHGDNPRWLRGNVDRVLAEV